jgi:uncharacterized protein (DUF983 family)
VDAGFFYPILLMSAFIRKLASMARMRCPKCHQGKLFINPNPYNLKEVEKMHSHCPVCEQDFVIEPGFYFGAGYVSYAMVVALVIIFLVGGFFILGIDTTTLFISLVATIVLCTPLMFRLSRSIWIHFFVGEGKQK